MNFIWSSLFPNNYWNIEWCKIPSPSRYLVHEFTHTQPLNPRFHPISQTAFQCFSTREKEWDGLERKSERENKKLGIPEVSEYLMRDSLEESNAIVSSLWGGKEAGVTCVHWASNFDKGPHCESTRAIGWRGLCIAYWEEGILRYKKGKMNGFPDEMSIFRTETSIRRYRNPNLREWNKRRNWDGWPRQRWEFFYY